MGIEHNSQLKFFDLNGNEIIPLNSFETISSASWKLQFILARALTQIVNRVENRLGNF